jgi:hypothetical protein
MADLSPNSALLHALANQALPWWKALAELVDNAFDAGAKRVEIIAKNKVLTVRDDGKGIKNILAIATLGHHDRQESTQLGMYGIGAKDAWLFCSEVLDVDTVHAGQHGTLRVDVRELVKNNWQCADPFYEPSDLPSGTTIRLPLRAGRNLPGQDAFEELAFAFTPAISNGLQILCDTAKGKGLPKALRPHVMPLVEEPVRSTFDIDGKEVQIDIGILPDGVKMDRGPLWLQYKHRILGRSSIGIGQYSSLRIAGRIILGEGWKLSKNKDDLTLHKDRLNDAIFVRIEGILKKASALSESIESAALRNLLETQLNDVIDAGKNKKPARDKGEKIGSVGPKSTPRKVGKASKTRGLDGNADCPFGKSGRKNGFIFDWENASTDTIGRFDRGGSRVFLNLDHPFVAAAKSAQNHHALLCCAAALIADNASRHDTAGNALLAFKFSDFSTALGGLMSSFKDVKANEKTAV